MDIEAKRGGERWVIQVREEAPNPAIANSFAAVLGHILQKMNDPQSKYSVALPDVTPFRRLWERLPETAKDRTGITALFVDPTGTVTEISK